MSEADELFEKLKANLAAEIKRQAESKVLPVQFRIGPRTTFREAAEQYGLACYRRVKHNRAYALDAKARLEIAALSIASQKAGKHLVEVIEAIASVAPNWLQQRPADPEIPALPIDKITGERLRNPFLPLPGGKPGDTPRYDHRSQIMLKEQSPRLAKWCEDAAKFGGPTVAMQDELEAERMEAEALRKVQYGDREWAANALRPDSDATLTAKGEFVKSINDPWLLETHRREAAMGSPRAGFDNLTIRMGLAKRSEEIREVHRKAGELVATWLQQGKEKAA
jgi:hypothetical protein